MAAILKGLATNKGLVGYWPLGNFGTVAGNVAVDLSGRQTRLSLNGTPRRIPGPFPSSSGLLFNGTTDYGTIATAPPSFASADYTLETWVNFTGAGLTGGTNNALFTNTPGGAGHYYFYLDGTSHLSLDIPFVVGALIVSASTLSYGVWYYVAVTKAGNNYTIFINGRSNATVTNASSPTTGGAFALGGLIGGVQLLNGALYNSRVLTRGILPPEAWARFANRSPSYGLIKPRARLLNSVSGFNPAWAIGANKVYDGVTV